jgi:hypothetical protein
VAVAVVADDATGREHWGVVELDLGGAPVTGFGTAEFSLDPGAVMTLCTRRRSSERAAATCSWRVDWAPQRRSLSRRLTTPPARPTRHLGAGVCIRVGGEQANDAVVQPDGMIDIVGTQSGMTALVIQLVASGMPNTEFGDDGTATFELQGDPSEALGATLDPSGHLVLAGGAVVNSGSQLDAALARVIVHLPPTPAISTTTPDPTVNQPISLSASAADSDGTVKSTRGRSTGTALWRTRAAL